jgi:hypothetical protein
MTKPKMKFSQKINALLVISVDVTAKEAVDFIFMTLNAFLFKVTFFPAMPRTTDAQ